MVNVTLTKQNTRDFLGLGVQKRTTIYFIYTNISKALRGSIYPWGGLLFNVNASH